MADVFISYKRGERQAVERLAHELRLLGLDVWFDASLNSGEAFSDAIDREAHAAKAILVCWSPTARESHWVKSEALIGFEQRKLAACYVAGPDGFYPPTPFNSIHAEDLRAWVGAPSNTHAGYKSLLRRIGALSGRADIESYGALDVQASSSTLRDWMERHPSSPLFMAVEELRRVRDLEEAERVRLEQKAHERLAREEAERRARDDAMRDHEAQVRRERIQREENARKENAPVARGAGTEVRARGAPWTLIIGAIVVAAFVVGGMLNWGRDQAPPMNQTRVHEPLTQEQSPSPQQADADRSVSPPERAGANQAVPSPVQTGANQAVPSPVQADTNLILLPEMVRIPGRNFEVGRYEVTFAQWDACVLGGGCNGYLPDDRGWGRGNRPVINVSINDAWAYVQWLTERTGQRYRLLNEAEWEYVARAGASTEFSWGDAGPTCNQSARNGANFEACPGDMTLPVGSFRPNAFGLYDVHGNVWEWVENCHDSNCTHRVVRGGSWGSEARSLRVANRNRVDPNLRYNNYLGFRVARNI